MIKFLDLQYNCYCVSECGMYEIEHNDHTGLWDVRYDGEFLCENETLSLGKDSCMFHDKHKILNGY